MVTAVSREFRLQMESCGLPRPKFTIISPIIQIYIWQEYDQATTFRS